MLPHRSSGSRGPRSSARRCARRSTEHAAASRSPSRTRRPGGTCMAPSPREWCAIRWLVDEEGSLAVTSVGGMLQTNGDCVCCARRSSATLRRTATESRPATSLRPPASITAPVCAALMPQSLQSNTFALMRVTGSAVSFPRLIIVRDQSRYRASCQLPPSLPCDSWM